MSEKTSCGCSADNKLIFACSGSADVGYLADKTARVLSVSGLGKMSCLAGLGGVASMIEGAKRADKVLVIDGCGVGCGKLLAEQAGLSFEHLTVTDLGLVKGSAPADGQNLDLVAAKARELLSCKG